MSVGGIARQLQLDLSFYQLLAIESSHFPPRLSWMKKLKRKTMANDDLLWSASKASLDEVKLISLAPSLRAG
jgi:hypothetical protein